MKKFIAVPLALLLVACMTMTKSECQSGEWSEAGYNDATGGLTSNRFKAHAKACEKHKVLSNKPLYDQGYEEGLAVYCQPESGIRAGRRADDYKGICPTSLESPFLRAYIRGLYIALDELDNRYADARDDLSDARYHRVRQEPDKDKVNRAEREIKRLQQLMREIHDKRANIRFTIAKWSDYQ